MAAMSDRCSYADVRHVARDLERLSVRNGRVQNVESRFSEGIGVRVRVGSAWGFAATSDCSRGAAERAATRAIAIPESQPTTHARPLAPTPPIPASWQTPY